MLNGNDMKNLRNTTLLFPALNLISVIICKYVYTWWFILKNIIIFYTKYKCNSETSLEIPKLTWNLITHSQLNYEWQIKKYQIFACHFGSSAFALVKSNANKDTPNNHSCMLIFQFNGSQIVMLIIWNVSY